MILYIVIVLVLLLTITNGNDDNDRIDKLLRSHHYQHPNDIISTLSIEEKVSLHRFLIHINGYNNNTNVDTTTTTITTTTTNPASDNTIIKNEKPVYNPIYCRDPDLGGHIPVNLRHQRKFLLIGGKGAGIGNFLIFYPAAYYFALLTGRDILIIDDSLIAEMCTILTCGYPKFNDVKAAFPAILGGEAFNQARSVKVFDFHRHFSGEAPLTDIKIVRADGYKFFSGWYLGRNDTEDCIAKLTGCARTDSMCHDRHALQRLIRGPFKERLTELEEKRIIGVPSNLRHAIMTLPHVFAPRLDAAIHLRSQFQHFEQLVGPDDPGWGDAVKQVQSWMNSTDDNAGQGLFKLIEGKIMEQFHEIKGKADAMKLAQMTNRKLRRLQSDNNIESEEFSGEDTDRIYVYIASDNEIVKEGLAKYLIGHANIAVMRVKNNDHIVHAKNIDYLKQAGNNTGVIDLILDWYALSLSNVVFAWRRDTDLISTFAQSAQRMSGNTEESDLQAGVGHGIGSKGLQLFFNKRGMPLWREF